jgi:hypothetical protein
MLKSGERMPRYPQSGHRISYQVPTTKNNPTTTRRKRQHLAELDPPLRRRHPQPLDEGGEEFKALCEAVVFQTPATQETYFFVGGFRVVSAWVDTIVGSVPGSVILSYLW